MTPETVNYLKMTPTHLATFQISRVFLAWCVQSHRNQKTDFYISRDFGDRDTGRVGRRVIEGIYSRNEDCEAAGNP